MNHIITKNIRRPGQPGTKKYQSIYGKDLVCVRYKYDYKHKKRYKTIELLVDEKEKKKFNLALQAMKQWIKTASKCLGTTAFMLQLKPRLQGHFNYYGVCGNIGKLNAFYRQTIRMVYKWLNRRSQRKSCNWRGFGEMLKFYNIPQPRIIGYW